MGTTKTSSQQASSTEGRLSRSAINTVAAQEVKRRGVGAIVDKLEEGPVHVLQHNQPSFVALGEQHYRELVDEVEEARIRASLADLEAGRVRFASPRELADEILG